MSRREMADMLGISEATVKNHRTHIKDKVRKWLRGGSLSIWALQHPEAVYTGFTRRPEYHPPGCTCDANPYCCSLRQMDWQGLAAA